MLSTSDVKFCENENDIYADNSQPCLLVTIYNETVS